MKQFKIVNVNGLYYVYKRVYFLWWDALNHTTYEDYSGDRWRTHKGFQTLDKAKRFAEKCKKNTYYV